MLSRLSHESILRYIDSCVNDDCLYIITEYCGGGDLEDYWQLCAKMEMIIPESLVSEWIFEIGGALKVEPEFQGQIVQSIVSLTSFLRGQLMCFTTL